MLPAPVVAANLDDGKKYATLLSAELPQVGGLVAMGGWLGGMLGRRGMLCCACCLLAHALPCSVPPAGPPHTMADTTPPRLPRPPAPARNRPLRCRSR